MTATLGTSALTNALAALTAARTPKTPGSNQPSFGDELAQAQHPGDTTTATPIGRRQEEADQQHSQQQQAQAQEQEHAQQQEHDVPRHPVLKGRSSSSGARRTPAATVRKPIAHPLPTPDPEAASALQAPVPTTPVVRPAQPGKPAAQDDTAASDGAAAPAAGAAAAASDADGPQSPAITALVAGKPSAAEAPGQQQPGATVPAGQADSAAAPVQITVTTTVPVAAATPAQPASPAQQSAGPAATPAATQPAAAGSAPPPSAAAQHLATQPGQPDPAAAPAQGAPTATAPDRAATDQGPSQQGHDQAPSSHPRAATAEVTTTSGPATPYSSATDGGQLAAPSAAAPAEARTTAEVPATQALPAGTLDQVNAAEHSVRVQVETQALGKVTADLHTRPGEIGVHLSVPDDAGRALMAQRLDALRDSLGQGGTAVHLSLTGEGSSSQGQQGSNSREDRAPARPDHQPHDAATPRAMDGSATDRTPTAPADGSRLVDVHA